MQSVGLDAHLVLCQESAEGGSSPFGWRGSPVARNRSYASSGPIGESDDPRRPSDCLKTRKKRTCAFWRVTGRG